MVLEARHPGLAGYLNASQLGFTVVLRRVSRASRSLPTSKQYVSGNCMRTQQDGSR